MMAIKPDWNTSNKTLAIKFAVYFVVVVVVWEIPGECVGLQTFNTPAT